MKGTSVPQSQVLDTILYLQQHFLFRPAEKECCDGSDDSLNISKHHEKIPFVGTLSPFSS